MKKFFALTVVLAALLAAGCGEKKESMTPPGDEKAAPADDAKETKDMPADKGAEETP
jgi:predicted small lipoprotein YifL